VIEHKKRCSTCKRLEKYGYEVTYLPCQDGRIDLDDPPRHHFEDDSYLESCTRTTRLRYPAIQEIGKIARKGRFVPYRRRAGDRQSFSRRATRQHYMISLTATNSTARRAAALSTCGVAIHVCSFRRRIRRRRTRARKCARVRSTAGNCGVRQGG